MAIAEVYCVRRMRREDVDQVAEIDREAFPGTWPVPNYRRELENRLAYYIVVYDRNRRSEPDISANVPPAKPDRFIPKLLRWLGFSQETPVASSRDYILGFAGIWVLVDEAHITSIAVRQTTRGKGVGELLLISVIEISQKLKAAFVTLEVRVSNTAAQKLYTKYGFNQVGVRKHYYTDNREDALLMTTDGISSSAYRQKLQTLKQDYFRNQGTPTFYDDL